LKKGSLATGWRCYRRKLTAGLFPLTSKFGELPVPPCITLKADNSTTNLNENTDNFVGRFNNHGPPRVQSPGVWSMDQGP